MLLSDFNIDDKFLAHTLQGEPSETLIEHSELTFEYYTKITNVKNSIMLSLGIYIIQ